jgi:tripartite-type tricarboxylate transporter receptor subunit TctC
VNQLSEACQKALKTPGVIKKLEELSVQPAPSTPEEFAMFIKAESAKWHDVITKAGISLN